MKTFTKQVIATVYNIIVFSFFAMSQAQATHTFQQSANPNVGVVDAEVAKIDETLSVIVRNVSDNTPVTGSRVTFPDGRGVVSSANYLEISFQSNVLGAFIRISTDNRRVVKDASGRILRTLANPAFKSGVDGILGTPDDEAFEPWKGVSGAGLVGTRTKGHGYVAPIFWVVFDNPVPGGYTFSANYAVEAVVLDKSQTHAFQADSSLKAELFNSSSAQAYASIIVGMNFVQGKSLGLIASFPEDIDGPSNGNLNGLRPAASPVCVYLGSNFTGMPGPMSYQTNTLRVELVHQ